MAVARADSDRKAERELVHESVEEGRLAAEQARVAAEQARAAGVDQRQLFDEARRTMAEYERAVRELRVHGSESRRKRRGRDA